MSEQISEIEYGNWVSKTFIYFSAILALIFLGLSFLSLFFAIGTVFFLVITAYFVYAYLQFSPKGSDLQAKIRGLVINQLVWDGDGTLLDIGCGNGAITIEAAKKYPKARIVGIDYWGGQRSYSKESCEKNARVSGVLERTSFQKASAAKLPFPENSFDAVVSNLVFHEVQDVRDKKEVIKEALRVLKKGGLFVFQDLFMWKRIYGAPEELIASIKSWGIQEVTLVNTSQLSFIPGAMKLPFMVGQIGIMYGRK